MGESDEFNPVKINIPIPPEEPDISEFLDRDRANASDQTFKKLQSEEPEMPNNIDQFPAQQRHEIIGSPRFGQRRP